MDGIIQHHSAGGVIFRVSGEFTFMIIKQIRWNGEVQWTLPKGHLENGESEQEAALREVEEEVGLKAADIETLFPLGELVYEFDERGERHHKRVSWFAMRAAPSYEAMLNEAEGFVDLKWLPKAEAAQQCSQSSLRDWLQEAIAKIIAHDDARN